MSPDTVLDSVYTVQVTINPEITLYLDANLNEDTRTVYDGSI